MTRLTGSGLKMKMAGMKHTPKRIRKTAKCVNSNKKETKSNYITFRDIRRDGARMEVMTVCFGVSPDYQVKRGDCLVMTRTPVTTPTLPTDYSHARWSVEAAVSEGLHSYQINITVPYPRVPDRPYHLYYVTPSGLIAGRGSLVFGGNNQISVHNDITQPELSLINDVESLLERAGPAGQARLSNTDAGLVKIWSTNFCRDKPSLFSNHDDKLAELAAVDVTSDPLRQYEDGTLYDEADPLCSVRDLVRRFEALRRQREEEAAAAAAPTSAVEADKTNMAAIYHPGALSLRETFRQWYTSLDGRNKLENNLHLFKMPPPLWSPDFGRDVLPNRREEALARQIGLISSYLQAQQEISAAVQAQSAAAVTGPAPVTAQARRADSQGVDVSLLRMENEVLCNQVTMLARRIELMQEKELEIGQLFLTQIDTQEEELKEKADMIRSLQRGHEELCPRTFKEASQLYISKLEYQLEEKTCELQELRGMLHNIKQRQTLTSPIVARNDKRASTNTDRIQETSLSTNTDKIQETSLSTNTDKIQTQERSMGTLKTSPELRTVIQKATSYAAPTISNKTPSGGVPERKKPNTLSERDMPVTPDWMELFKKLEKVAPAPQSKPQPQPKCHDRISESSVSDGSLGNVIRALFEESSLSSLSSVESTHNQVDVEKSDSVLECLYNLFGLDYTERVLAKSSRNCGVPAAPCNSRNCGVPAAPCNSRSDAPTCADPVAPQPSLSSSSSLQLALRRLFSLEGKESTQSSTGSLTDLGEAMRKLFYTASMERLGLAPKRSLFGTSNTSLEDAMKLLFDSRSKSTIANTDSLDSIPLWGLFDSEPEETITKTGGSSRPVAPPLSADVRARDMFDVESWLAENKLQRRASPNVASVFRSSSPDRDVNIMFPRRNATTRPVFSEIPRPASPTPTLRCKKPRAARRYQRSVNSRRCVEHPRKRSKHACPHCDRSITSPSEAQTLFRPRRHMAASHASEE